MAEYGQSATAAFKKLLKEKQPDVEFVAEQAPPPGKIDAGAVARALADAKPDAIFSSLFGPDLAKFVREGQTRGLFKGWRGLQSSGRRAGISRSAEGRVARRLVRHGLSVERAQDAGAHQVPQCLPGQVQGLSAARLRGRLCDGDVGRRGHQEGRLARSGEAGRAP